MGKNCGFNQSGNNKDKLTGRFNRAVLILAACNLFTLQAVFPQDTIKFVPPKISLKEPGFILSEHRYKYVSLHKPDTLTRVRSFWYPSKANDDIFSFLPGYYLSYMDVGQVNNLRYNQLDPNNTAVFRHERPVNDLIDGSADLNLFSRNEIAEIENIGGYGNYLNNDVNTVNIIQNQIFRNRPYTELSFHQDRFDNRVVSIRLPSTLLNELRAISSQTDISYQDLIRLFLSEAVSRFKKRSAA